MAKQSVLLSAGSNSGGQLGLGHCEDTHKLQVCLCDEGEFPPPGFTISQLSSGSNHTVALIHAIDDSSNVQLWVSGSGHDGQLGKEKKSTTMFERLDLKQDLGSTMLGQPVLIACGWTCTFVVLRSSISSTDDHLLVLGRDNDFGQLGVGEEKSLEGGVGLVDLGRTTCWDKKGYLRITDIACGLRHTIIRCEREGHKHKRVELYGWGAARHGQLDTAEVRKPPAVYWHPHLIDEWECKQTQPSTSKLCAGKEHSIYHSYNYEDRGSLRVFGSNRQGQKHVVENVNEKLIIAAACTWSATIVALKQVPSGKERIIGSGDNRKGQIGGLDKEDGIVEAELATRALAGEDRHIESLVCGSEHTLVLIKGAKDSPNEVWGWGWNEHGNLAQGDEADRRAPVQIWPVSKSDIVSKEYGQATHIWAGCGTTFIQVTKDIVK